MNISVIMPIYNAEKYLKKSIISVLNQTYRDFELILVNDGSKDNSLDICKKYAMKDNRIKIIDQENSGCVLARKKGIEIAKGEYIVFIDADDWMHPKLLEKLYLEAKRTNSDIVACKYKKTLSKLTFIHRDEPSNFENFYSNQSEYNGKEIKDILVKSFLGVGGSFPPQMMAKIYKKSLFDNKSIRYAKNIKFFGEDVYQNIGLFLNAKKISMINEVLYYYRRGGGTSRYMEDYFDDIITGVRVREKVISEHYCDIKESIYPSLYTHVLELYKSCLFNLLYSNYNEDEIKNIISNQLEHEVIIHIANSMKNIYFDKSFLEAVHNKDIEYLYNLSLDNKKKIYIRQKILSIL